MLNFGRALPKLNIEPENGEVSNSKISCLRVFFFWFHVSFWDGEGVCNDNGKLKQAADQQSTNRKIDC